MAYVVVYGRRTDVRSRVFVAVVMHFLLPNLWPICLPSLLGRVAALWSMWCEVPWTIFDLPRKSKSEI